MNTRLRLVCLERPNDATLVADLRSRDTSLSQPIVIVCHGFRTHKDWGFFPMLGLQLARAGAHTLVLNFSRNGYQVEPSGSEQVRHPFQSDRFASNTVAQELKDLRDLLNAIRSGWLKSIDVQWNGQIFLVGHSRGSGICLLASQHSADVAGLCLWSAIRSFDRTTARQKHQWRQQGFIEMEKSSSGPGYRMNIDFLEDLEQHQQEYSLMQAAAQCRVPVHFIVGAQDMVSPVAESQDLISQISGSTAELHVLTRCGHSLNCTEPFRESSDCLREAILITQRSFALQPPLLSHD